MNPNDPAVWVPWTVFVTALGACIGSFLNVCIHRIPREESVVRPPSHCPHCGTRIAWYDNLPLVSYFMLRARCRHCRHPISARYVLVEALTSLLFLLAWLRYEPVLARPILGLQPLRDVLLVPVHWLFFSGLILGTFVDLDHMIIPDRVSLGGIAAGLVLSLLVPALHGADSAWPALRSSLIGAAVGAGLLWTVAALGTFAFKKEAMGMGDVKLMGAIGAFTGWNGVVFTLMISSFVGSIAGITLIMLRGKAWQSRIPYGPYLALAAVLWMLWGEHGWDTYVRWLSASTAMPS